MEYIILHHIIIYYSYHIPSYYSILETPVFRKVRPLRRFLWNSMQDEHQDIIPVAVYHLQSGITNPLNQTSILSACPCQPSFLSFNIINPAEAYTDTAIFPACYNITPLLSRYTTLLVLLLRLGSNSTSPPELDIHTVPHREARGWHLKHSYFPPSRLGP